jgi:hypothetical protein
MAASVPIGKKRKTTPQIRGCPDVVFRSLDELVSYYDEIAHSRFAPHIVSHIKVRYTLVQELRDTPEGQFYTMFILTLMKQHAVLMATCMGKDMLPELYIRAMDLSSPTLRTRIECTISATLNDCDDSMRIYSHLASMSADGECLYTLQR